MYTLFHVLRAGERKEATLYQTTRKSVNKNMQILTGMFSSGTVRVGFIFFIL